MSVQHAPAPWIIEDGWLQSERGAINDGHYFSICMSATTLADGMLITASPDLLEAAKNAKVLIGARNDTLSEAVRQANINEAWHILDRAIAKATGGAA
ncbi:hypothetical protein [Sphingopyxis indica]|uniref:Uncharacterized protein n=1 Tax=Sphingopyxis indica TaxID=436663 RepID=A0A239KNZ6_9SPHN|nr:hypothetical protein [Sphingopyxis indica]SNT20097.1 hypothetical protein SAMN06295955_11593 [Sphingopyxis indica]